MEGYGSENSLSKSYLMNSPWKASGVAYHPLCFSVLSMFRARNEGSARYWIDRSAVAQTYSSVHFSRYFHIGILCTLLVRLSLQACSLPITHPDFGRCWQQLEHNYTNH